jgi:hypothetical protein
VASARHHLGWNGVIDPTARRNAGGCRRHEFLKLVQSRELSMRESILLATAITCSFAVPQVQAQDKPREDHSLLKTVGDVKIRPTSIARRQGETTGRRLATAAR